MAMKNIIFVVLLNLGVFAYGAAFSSIEVLEIQKAEYPKEYIPYNDLLPFTQQDEMQYCNADKWQLSKKQIIEFFANAIELKNGEYPFIPSYCGLHCVIKGKIKLDSTIFDFTFNLGGFVELTSDKEVRYFGCSEGNYIFEGAIGEGEAIKKQTSTCSAFESGLYDCGAL